MTNNDAINDDAKMERRRRLEENIEKFANASRNKDDDFYNRKR